MASRIVPPLLVLSYGQPQQHSRATVKGIETESDFSEGPDQMAPDVADRKNAWRFEHMVGGKYSFSNQNPNPAAMTLPENMLLAWAHAHPDVAPAFLAAIVPALTNRNPDAGEQTWHPMMKCLLDEFGDREDVLRALTRNMCTFG